MSSLTVNQSSVFFESESDAWFERNFKEASKQHKERDLALSYLLAQGLDGKTLLEVGCADGWRLDELNKVFNVHCIGIEPSAKAIDAGKARFKNIDFIRGSASELSVEDNSVDVLISGFCLYLCDRNELFKIAYEYDRVLKDGGLIVITDFYSSFPYRNGYSHKSGLHSYKMDYGSMFTWNPFYTVVTHQVVDMTTLDQELVNPDNKVTLTVIRKRKESSYPLEPYAK